MNVFDRIDGALIAALKSVPGVGLVELEPAGDPDAFPASALFATGAVPIEREVTLIRWRGSYTVEGYVQRGDGMGASTDRNAFYAACMAAIMVDDTLGGAVELVEFGDLRRSTAMLAEQRRLSFAQDLVVQFTTLRTNPALPA